MATLLLRRRRPRWLTTTTGTEPNEPAAALPSDETRPTRPELHAIVPPHGFRILIVDDDHLMTDMLPRRLRRVIAEGIDIVTAANADEAEQRLRERPADAVLCDYNLRDARTGLDVLKEAQALAPDAVRILLSGHTRREIDGIDVADIHEYIEKPMRLDELIAPILAVIQREKSVDLRRGDEAA